MSWGKLAESYQKSGVVLVLGAGVSEGVGVPTWGRLLERLANGVAASGRHVEYGELIRHGLTYPIIASLFEEYSGSRKDFVEHVRKALYETFPFFPEGVSKKNRREFVRYVKENNLSLHAVGTFCAVPREGTDRYEPNPLVGGIVTFNLDAVLQAYVYARFEKRLLRTIERASASAIATKINIYHMHGFLRFDRLAGDLSKDAPDAVILTEQDYFNFFNDPTSLFNYTFLYLLREAHCLFLGLSMKDENIRRMLHLSKLERMRALIREGVSRGEARERSLRHFAVLKRSAVAPVDEAIEKTLLPLGTMVLWVEDWPEVPERLRELYESTGRDWSVVR